MTLFASGKKPHLQGRIYCIMWVHEFVAQDIGSQPPRLLRRIERWGIARLRIGKSSTKRCWLDSTFQEAEGKRRTKRERRCKLLHTTELRGSWCCFYSNAILERFGEPNGRPFIQAVQKWKVRKSGILQASFFTPFSLLGKTAYGNMAWPLQNTWSLRNQLTIQVIVGAARLQPQWQIMGHPQVT